MQGWDTVKLDEALYITQSVKTLSRFLRLVSKVATVGATKEKRPLKNGVNVNLDAIKGRNESTMLYLKSKRYAYESLKPQKANIISQRKKFLRW